MASSLTEMVNKALTKAAGLANQGKSTTSNSLAGKTAKDLTRVEVYDFLNNATPEEKAYYYGHHTNEKGEEVSNGIPQSYVDRYIPQTYAFWNAGNSTIGDYGIDDSNTDTWKRIQAMYNSGDVNGAYDLINALADKGKFGGYYDDNGQYWGFAQGYLGGANSSYLPVVGGKILSNKGLDTTGTNIWLTPDGKALHADANGALTDMGDTWSRYGNGDIVRAGLKRLDDLDASTQAFIEQNGGRYPEAPDPVPNGNGGLIYSYGGGNNGGSTIYQQMLSQTGNSGGYTNLIGNPNDSGTFTTLPGNPNDPGNLTPYQQVLSQTGNSGGASGGTSGGASGGAHPTQQSTVSTQQYIAAPEAYDPNSDTLYQQYLKDWANKQAPEYAGDPYQAQRDAALAAYGEKWGGSEYQPLRDQYLQNAANMEWNFDPSTDPVWQAYQKQYRREGQRATEDTMGRYAAMTGGMPSTAAVTAASQAGDYYASQLSDKLPEVYQQAYQRYLQEYQRQLGLSDAYAGFDDREYQRWLQSQAQNLDLANAYNQYGQLDYQKYLDQLSQFNTDRNFNYNAARDNQALGRQANQDEYQRYLDALSQANYEDETAYNRYRDTISDQRYDQEWAQQLREYADQQNWKATEWQQYLREYGDKLSQQEKEWAMQQAQYADDNALAMAKLGAQYGDYSGLSGMGIDTSSANPKEVAYASDGSMYKFNTPDAQYFVKNAPTGATMTGSDGSTWRKDEYGGITITTKNGKVFTYSNSVVPETTSGSGYRYTGNGGNGGNGGDGETKSDMEALRAKAPKTYADALDFLMNERGLSYNPANAMAKDYIASLDTGDQGEAPEDQTADYRNLTESLNWMVQSGRSRDEIYTEINAAVRDKLITKEQGEALKNQYYGQSDNVKNVTLDNGKIKTHSDGLPVSVGYDNAEQTVSRMTDSYEIGSYLKRELDAGRIHEYEIAKIVYQAGQRGGGYTPGQDWN